jgi:hypothetical protein
VTDLQRALERDVRELLEVGSWSWSAVAVFERVLAELEPPFLLGGDIAATQSPGSLPGRQGTGPNETERAF